jgi:hypothetical protein
MSELCEKSRILLQEITNCAILEVRARHIRLAVLVGLVAFLASHTGVGMQASAAGSLAITAPAADGNRIHGAYTFAADVGALSNVATVEFNVGSLRLGVAEAAPYQVIWNTGYGKDGEYAVQAVARDASGRVVATTERVFQIDNNGVKMTVSSPDLSRELSGTVTLEVTAVDPISYPAIFHLFVDGELSGYWDVGDSPGEHRRTARIQLDTTKFSNGRHELVVELNGWKETAHPHTYTNYSAMADRMISIRNGRAVMEIAASHQHVYLRPGQTLALSCRRLYTDDTIAPCAAPAYKSDRPAAVSVSAAGRLRAVAEGFAAVEIADSGKTTKVYVWVKNNSHVPHFSGSGQLLNAYKSGRSMFPVAPFVLDPADLQADARLLEETRRAGFNTVSFGFYLNPRNTEASFADWRSSQDSILTSRIRWAKENGFHILATGDDAFRRPGDDAWWTLNWTHGERANQYAMETLARSGVAIAVDIVDEAAMLWGWYPVGPSRVGQQGRPGQPGSFYRIDCSGLACTVHWPEHGYRDGRWVAFHGSLHPELNTPPGKPFVVQHSSRDRFEFTPNAPITGSFNSENDSNLEILLFAAWPCNAGAADGKEHPCNPFTPNDGIQTYSNWLRKASPRVPFSWPALGLLPPAAHSNWVGRPALEQGISDYASHYWDVLSGSRTYSWSNGVQQRTFWMKDAFYSRQPYVAQDHPQLMLVCGSSFAYLKQNSKDPYYNPLTDALDQPGCDGPVAVAEIMTAAALGNVGVRQYQFDRNDPRTRAEYPSGTYLQTGMRPDAAERNAKEIWKAAGYAANLLTKVLEPYILGTAANSPAYSRNITTAVRRGPDGIMLMIVNGSDAERSVNVEFAPYRSGGDIARYRLASAYLQSDLLRDGTGEMITLPKGGSVTYFFPSKPGVRFLQPVRLKPELPKGAIRASLSYNYIYGEHLPELTESIDCTKGCTVQVDPRLGEIRCRFTYSDADGTVIRRELR